MEVVRGHFRVWYEGCVIQVILFRNKWVGIAYALIPLWDGGGAHTPPVLANFSLEEKAKGDHSKFITLAFKCLLI